MIAMEFLNPGRLWWLLAVAALAVAYVAAQQWRRRTTLRFTAIDLLDRVAPHRPGWRRHVVAGVQLLGLAVGVVAIARPIERETVRTESEGRILVLFDVSLSMIPPPPKAPGGVGQGRSPFGRDVDAAAPAQMPTDPSSSKPAV